jgi:hypothetical protein
MGNCITQAFIFLKWAMRHFSTREHFQRFLATWIIFLGVHDALKYGKIEDSALVLVGGVVGFYFKDRSACCQDQEQDEKKKPPSGPQSPNA